MIPLIGQLLEGSIYTHVIRWIMVASWTHLVHISGRCITVSLYYVIYIKIHCLLLSVSVIYLY